MIQFCKDLRRHAREFARAIADLNFDQSETGLYFPRSRSFVQGVFEHRVRKATGELTPWVADHNLVPTEGLTYLIGLIGAETKITNWYMALYAGAYTPAAGLTAANFTSTATEITSGTEGHTESTRVAVTWGTAAAGSINNNAAPSAFTIATATTLTVNGVGILSASAKGATTGKLLAASRFASARTLNDTDVFEVKYTVTGTST